MGTRPRVLLVEDHPGQREAFDLSLTEAGFDVTCAADGDEALRVLHESTRPEVVVADVRMPRLPGDQLLELMRRNPALATLPVVLISAFPPPASAFPGASMLVKPFPTRALVEAVQESLRTAGAHADRRGA